jgi:hypothetical protein
MPEGIQITILLRARKTFTAVSHHFNHASDHMPAAWKSAITPSRTNGFDISVFSCICMVCLPIAKTLLVALSIAM